MIIKLKVQPGAKKNEIVGAWLDSIKIRVTARPEAGKANKACINLLAEQLNIPKSNIAIVRGHASKEKQISVSGVSKDELLARLNLTPD